MDRERKETPECHSSSEEEKEQLSPLSVLEFPSEGEEEEEVRASSHTPLKLQSMYLFHFKKKCYFFY